MNVLERLIQAFENYKSSTTFNLPKRSGPTKSIVDNEKLTALADAIRTKTGSSDSLTIDDMKTAVDNFSGGATIEKEGEYIPVPNHEEIENVYFNINMTPEEVDTYLDNAGLTDTVPSEAGWSYSIFDDDYEHSIVLAKFDMGGMVGYAILANTEVTSLITYISPSLEAIAGELVPDNPFTGWNPNLIAANGVVGVNDHARTSTPSGEPSGTQNDLIAKLINIGGSEGYKKVLSGKYEPVELEINEPKKVDLTTYMDNQQMPISVNVVGGGEDRLKRLLDTTQSVRLFAYLGKKMQIYNFPTNEHDYKTVNVYDLLSYEDTKECIDFGYMFYFANIDKVPIFNTDKAQLADKMFFYTKTTEPITDISFINFNIIRQAYQMFYGCSSLEVDNLVINAPKMESMYGAFSGTNIKNANITISNALVRDAVSYLFQSCTQLKTITLTFSNSVDIAQRVDLVGFARNCTNLTSLTINFNNLAKPSGMGQNGFNSMCNGCINLVNVEFLNTIENCKGVDSINSMFYNCTSLETTPTIDLSNIYNSTYYSKDVLYGCKNIKNINFINIKTPLTIGTGDGTGANDYGTLLTLDSLINTCKECIDPGTSRTLTIGSANMEKIANVYVKFVDPSITDILTNEKGEVEVCESTDEGAMTIAQYMSLKSWTLA